MAIVDPAITTAATALLCVTAGHTRVASFTTRATETGAQGRIGPSRWSVRALKNISAVITGVSMKWKLYNWHVLLYDRSV